MSILVDKVFVVVSKIGLWSAMTVTVSFVDPTFSAAVRFVTWLVVITTFANWLEANPSLLTVNEYVAGFRNGMTIVPSFLVVTLWISLVSRSRSTSDAPGINPPLESVTVTFSDPVDISCALDRIATETKVTRTTASGMAFKIPWPNVI